MIFVFVLLFVQHSFNLPLVARKSSWVGHLKEKYAVKYKKYKWGFLGRGAWTGHTYTRYAIPLPPPKSLLGHKALFVNKMFSFSLLSIEFNCPTFCKPTSFLRFFSSFASWNIQLGTSYIHIQTQGLSKGGGSILKVKTDKNFDCLFYTAHLSGL